MLYNTPANRRIKSLLRILTNANPVFANNVRAYISTDSVAIGEVTKVINKEKRPEYVPRNYYREDLGQPTLHHLRWMMQKDILGQDIFLLGPPGPQKRNLAMQYLELTNREHEYVALSRDTTESDLKQRREIVKGTAKYFDQSAVRAAVEGRILILEGIEKAERNVLPVLNNLLENREMHLEDGRLLIPASRYDTLLEQYGKDDLEKWKLVRVDENFRVIALGLPVPRYRGNPLDPPLRSRFQARDVHVKSYQECYRDMKGVAPKAPEQKIGQLLSCAFAISTKECDVLGLPDFPIDNLPQAARLLEYYPDLSSYNVFVRLYPYHAFLKDQKGHLETLLGSFGVTVEERFDTRKVDLVPGGVYIQTEYQNGLITELLQSEKVGDFCLIGPKGCGKSLLVGEVAKILRKQIENIVLYQDMTSRDLIQQRSTLDNGDTIWKLSPLILAALEGKIAVLDGINRIHPSTLSVLHRLVQNRELQLHDGKRLISDERYQFIKNNFNLTDDQLKENGVLRIHPDFRIIAIGEPPNNQSAQGNWVTPEVLSLFLFHNVRTLSKQEELHIITSKFGPAPKPLTQIIELAHLLRTSPDQTLQNLSGHLSTRQLLRIAARFKNYPTTTAYDTIQTIFMTKFLPTLPRQALEKTIQKLGIYPNAESVNQSSSKYDRKNGTLTIGQSQVPIYQTENLSKVPKILFYDVPHHVDIMEKMLQDFFLGHPVLLVGNQGVGKNKIVDRFLELMNRPREYIQLHRDTTVQTLTTQPTVIDGILVHEDSPLVKAVKYGHVLVIDEADKAPTHVTCILKTLVESGEMILSDGRRIISTTGIVPPAADEHNFIRIHPDFRVVVLANRPGFPFLGNDFFGALGDLFSSYAVENPSPSSEIDLLRNYGPNVDLSTIKRLVGIFGDLRNLADQGLVSYPYSTREVVNIVKHLNEFPEADLEDVVFNVFDFDRYSREVVEVLGEVLEKHGFSSKNVMTKEYIEAKRAKEKLQVTVNSFSGLDTKEPKHGKEDPDNKPHVGGNTWAGGSGGRDTAGLGGKGGPYRLDKGHEVHQLSEEEINSVPDHIQRAAREMAKKAFEQKLKEIGMSGYDATIYNQFYNSVSRQIQSLRVILGNLQAKNKERQWRRNQTGGELDDVKLIDGLLGEKTIFRRRKEEDPEIGAPQTKPKIFRVVVDVSGSMYRFNGYDGRLDRELEAAVLVMEAFQDFDNKVQYDIIGHSGESPSIPFIKMKEPPKNNKERLDVIRTMHAHAQYCWSGDHTLEATEMAINSLSEEDCDEGIVVVLSDANLQRYGIPPAKLGGILTSKTNISAYVIFIGSLGDQAERLTEKLPAGRAFICNDVSQLPQILKEIFSSSVINI